MKVRACDDIDNCSIQTVEFNLILDDLIRQEQISVSLTSPGNGWAVTRADFPLPIKFSVNRPDKVSQINVYFFEENNPAQSLISTITPSGPEVSTSWITIPETGTYKLYGEVIGKASELTKSNEVIVVVNNTTKEEK